MGRYNFKSPFAEAGNAIEELLLQRRVEERQRLLDEMAMKNAEISRRAQEEAITASTEARQDAALNMATAGLPIDADVSHLDPTVRSWGVKRGRIASRKSKPTPRIYTDETFRDEQGNPAEVMPEGSLLEGFTQAVPHEPPPPAGPTQEGFFYAGDPKEMQEERDRQRRARVIMGMLTGRQEDPYVAAAKDQGLLATEFDQSLPESFFRNLGVREPYRSFDREDGSMQTYDDILAPPGATDTILEHQARRKNYIHIANTELGAVVMDPETSELSIQKVPGGGSLLPKSGSKSNRPDPNKPILDNGVAREMAKLRAESLRNSAGIAAWRARVPMVINQANVNEDVRQAARALWSTQDPRSISEIIEELRVSNPEITVDEVNDLRGLLYHIWGENK